MFCSVCGKTIKSEATVCPHCGAPLGTWFGGGRAYTAAQPKYDADIDASELRGADAEGYTPYTRTNYNLLEQQEQDVYSRTTYRPVLREEESAPEEPVDAPAEPESLDPEQDAPASTEEPAQQTSAEANEESGEKPQPARKPSTRIVRREITPVEKSGISPEVQRYMQRVEEERARQQGAPKAGIKLPWGKKQAEYEDVEEPALDIPGADLPKEDGAGAALKGAASSDDGEQQAAPRRSERRQALQSKLTDQMTGKLNARKVLSWAVVLAVIAGIIVGGIMLVGILTTQRAPIAGVTLELYKQGIEMLEARTTDDYRKNMVKLITQDATKASITQTTERVQLQALMPEEPLENDALFMQALETLQESIHTAVTMDALASASLQQSGNTTLSAATDDEWLLISNAIGQLKTMENPAKLNSIIIGAKVEIETTPTPAPTLPEYTTLRKGMNDNGDVKKLQNRLYNLGFFDGERDSDFGARTETAVKRFQKAAGLEQTGVADAETQAAMYDRDAPRTGDKVTPAPTAKSEPTSTPEAE